MPIFQNGSYPSLPFEFVQKLKAELAVFDYDRIQMKKESKLKEIYPNKTMKGWGSKNSQMRLDKATSRNAKKMNKGEVAKY